MSENYSIQKCEDLLVLVEFDGREGRRSAVIELQALLVMRSAKISGKNSVCGE